MKRKIFIGSSHEGYEEALQVCEAMRQLNDSKFEPRVDLDPQLWTTFFDAGSLTFEALEDMLRLCCGAVFIIRRDDIVRHLNSDGYAMGTRKTAYMPRGNVLVEFGLVAGRLGRRNVALCRLADAELPSDLAGMTIVEMSPKRARAETVASTHAAVPTSMSSGLSAAASLAAETTTKPFDDEALQRLHHWASHLLATTWGIERTMVFHGYTGRWQFELHLKKWRGVLLSSATSYVIVNGFFDLFISSEGVGSFGSISGTLSCRLESSDGNLEYMADLHVFHTISNIECSPEGAVELTSQLLSVRKISEIGTAPDELRTIGSGSEPWMFKWTLNPNGGGQLAGLVCTTASGGTNGDITASKLRMIR